MNGKGQGENSPKKGYKVRQSKTTHRSVYKPDAVVREPSRKEKDNKRTNEVRKLTDGGIDDKISKGGYTNDSRTKSGDYPRDRKSANARVGASSSRSEGSSSKRINSASDSREADNSSVRTSSTSGGRAENNSARNIGSASNGHARDNSSSNTENSSEVGTSSVNASTRADQTKTQSSAKAKKRRSRRPQDSGFIKPTDVIRVKGSYDRMLLILVIIITLFGLIMDFSASYAYALNSTGDSMFFIKKQALFAVVGFAAMFVAMQFDYKWLRRATVPFFIFSLLLLLAVLVYGVASGEAQRWINIAGISIQPSEIAKLSLILVLALYVARNQDRITNYRNFWQSSKYGVFIPILIILIPCMLVFLENHFSGTIILLAVGMIVLFACGARLGWFVGVGASAVALIIPFIFLTDYARERVDMLLHPENYEITGKIWQTMQGLYAIGSGGLFGVGLGNSRQKHLFVSQPQNDFVFSIICEELGFAGALLVIALFVLIIWRGFVIALRAPDTFTSLTVIGITCKIAIQAILNIAVVTNLIPNTGISLPFFSYGGTALMMQLAEMGIVLAISRYSYQKREDAAALTAISSGEVIK